MSWCLCSNYLLPIDFLRLSSVTYVKVRGGWEVIKGLVTGEFDIGDLDKLGLSQSFWHWRPGRCFKISRVVSDFCDLRVISRLIWAVRMERSLAILVWITRGLLRFVVSFLGLVDRARFMTHNVIDVSRSKTRFQKDWPKRQSLRSLGCLGYVSRYVFRSVGGLHYD